MIYHGGPVLTGGVTIYPIFYGQWGEADKTVVRQFVSSLGGSAWLQWATAYYDATGRNVQNVVRLGYELTDPYTFGSYLTSRATAQIIEQAVGSGALPCDPNGIYAVLGAPGVGNQFGDGFHFALGALASPSGICSSQGLWVASGGITPGESVIAVMSHEFIETVTDPYGSAWYTSGGLECADICGYGRTTIGGTQHQIANYAVPGGGCITFSVNTPPPPPPPQPPPCTPRGKSGKCK